MRSPSALGYLVGFLVASASARPQHHISFYSPNWPTMPVFPVMAKVRGVPAGLPVYAERDPNELDFEDPEVDGVIVGEDDPNAGSGVASGGGSSRPTRPQVPFQIGGSPIIQV